MWSTRARNGVRVPGEIPVVATPSKRRSSQPSANIACRLFLAMSKLLRSCGNYSYDRQHIHPAQLVTKA